jgi:hypothetical protein
MPGGLKVAGLLATSRLIHKFAKRKQGNVHSNADAVSQKTVSPELSEPSGAAECSNGEERARTPSPSLFDVVSSTKASKKGANRWATIAAQRQQSSVGTSSMKRISRSVRNDRRPVAPGSVGEADVAVKVDGWGAHLRWKIFWAKDAVPGSVGLIHHLSPFARYWPRVVSTSALVTALFLPPVVCWGQGEWEGFLFQFLMGGVLIANAIVRQVTTVSTSRKPLQTHAEIRHWYVRNELWLDLLSTVPYGVLAVPGVILPNPRGSLELLRLLQWLCLMRIFRDVSLEQLASILLETPGVYKWLGTLKLLGFWFLHLHLCACLLHFCATRYDIGPEGLAGWLALDAPAEYLHFNGLDQYLICYYEILQAQTGSQLSASTNRSEIVFGIYNNIFGAIIAALLLGKLAGKNIVWARRNCLANYVENGSACRCCARYGGRHRLVHPSHAAPARSPNFLLALTRIVSHSNASSCHLLPPPYKFPVAIVARYPRSCERVQVQDFLLYRFQGMPDATSRD